MIVDGREEMIWAKVDPRTPRGMKKLLLSASWHDAAGTASRRRIFPAMDARRRHSEEPSNGISSATDANHTFSHIFHAAIIFDYRK